MPRPLRRLVVAGGERRVLEITEEMIALRFPRAKHPHVQITYSQLEHRLFMGDGARPRSKRRGL